MKATSDPILISATTQRGNRISGPLYLVLITGVAALGGLLFGYDTAVISGAIGLLKDHFALSAAATGWAASSALAGCVLGAAGAGKGSDLYGRHKMLVLSGICFLISAIGTALASTFTLFIAFRTVGGLGIGAASVASPLYIGESAPAQWRGRLVALNQLAIVFGMLLIYLVNYRIHLSGTLEWNRNMGWRWMFASGILSSALLLGLLFVVREQKKEAEARTLVINNAVPLWMKMAPMVRDTMLTYHAVVATRNDQGQLASMQNKFVRIALERLRLSIKEFVDELPPVMDAAYAAAISPASANPPRLFMPTRPSLLNAGNSIRIFIIAPGQTDVTDVKLHTRRLGEQQWKSVSAEHAGRAVYTAQLGPFQASDATIEYYAAAPGNPSTMSAPPQAPVNLYTLNVLSS